MLDLTRLHDAVRHEGGVSRRLFMAYAASLSSACVLSGRARGATASAPSFGANPFSVGVASGDPSPNGAVLWTRLAPKPLEPHGGLPPENIEVNWEIADDDTFKTIVQRGTTIATPQLGHSVHVEAEGLKPDRWYWYRFRAGDAESPVGRTRTTPLEGDLPQQLKFAFASCQHFESGLYTAYQHMANDGLDLVIHLGDYIYEKGPGSDGVRKHVGGEINTLEDYRIRHALYKTDPHLQAMHAQCPWVVVWDDHEVDNNYAGAISEELNVDPVDFLVRRANAYQAYYEMMPLAKRSLPQGPNMKIYRQLAFGQLANFFALDTRQYRCDQPNKDKDAPLNEAACAAGNSLLGAEQRGWLEGGLIGSTGQWNVLAQQVMMGIVDRRPGELEGYSMDQWCGCVHERNDMMQFVQDRNVPNVVVLTGDIHSNWVNDLRTNDRQADAPVVATEFVGTSISSGGNGVDKPKDLDTILAENPGVRFHNRQRGYVRCTVTKDKWQSDYQVVEDVTKPDVPVVTRASFVVEAGKAGAQPT